MFILPINDSPNVRAIPWLTWSLALCHLFALIWIEWPALGDAISTSPFAFGPDELDGESLTFPRDIERLTTLWTEHAYWAPHPDRLSLLSGIFLHPGALAAVVGVFLLTMFGDNVEHHLGRRLFAAIYFGGGILGTLVTSLFMTPVNSAPIVGSGAALGAVMGGYFVFFGRSEIRVAYLTGRPALRNGPGDGGGAPYIPARPGILFCLAIATFAGIFSGHHPTGLSRAVDSILPGFVIGLLAAYALHRSFGDPSTEGTAAWYPNKLLLDQSPGEHVASLIRAKKLDDAARAYLKTKDNPRAQYAPGDLERIGAWLGEHGMVAAAEGARRRLADDDSRRSL